MKTPLVTISISVILLFAISGSCRFFRPEMKKCQQWETSWCWAGTAQAICTWYGGTATNEECAHIVTTENKAQSMSAITKIINKYFPGYGLNPQSGALSEEECKAEADKGAPFGINWPNHFVAYGGYEGSNHLVMNPAPAGRPPKEGGQWHENCTYNYILTAKNSTSGKWAWTCKTKGKPAGFINKGKQDISSTNAALTVASLSEQRVVLRLPNLANAAGTLSIYNLHGKLVHSIAVKDNSRTVAWDMTTTTNTAGTYVANYSLNSQNQHFTTKIIIEK